MNDAAAQDEEGNHDDQGGEGGEDGSAQGLVDAGVHGVCKGTPAEPPRVLPNPVEDDDGVVQGIPHDGQERGDDAEGDLPIGQGEGAHGDDDIVDQGHNGSHGVLQPEEPADTSDAQTEVPAAGGSTLCAGGILPFALFPLVGLISVRSYQKRKNRI